MSCQRALRILDALLIAALLVLAGRYIIILSDGDSLASGYLQEKTSENKTLPKYDSLEEFLKAGSIDINKADRETLIDLPGIGEVLADRIIEYREQHGDFPSLEGLSAVKGIGQKKIDALRGFAYAEAAES